jgi:ribosomal protein L37E
VSRLRRFLRIERARSERPDGDPSDGSPGTTERFEAVERPGERPGAPRSSGADLDRFGPEPEPSIELVEAGPSDRPFTRCMRCGMDHNVFAAECSGCGASLDTEPQREFNEKLWARRREDAAREASAEAERKERAARAEAELAAARRAMGEELAREVGRHERRRLGMDDGLGGGWGGLGGGTDSGYGGPPLGFRLLRALPDWRWQVGAIAIGIGVVGGLVAYGRAGHPGALLAAMLLVVVLAVPQWRTRDW